jgi:hypothetical protein
MPPRADASNRQVTLSFYPQDVKALSTRLRELRQHGTPARAGLLLRALVHRTPEPELVAHAVLLARKFERDGWPSDRIAKRPAIDLSPDDLRKLDRVLVTLDRNGITEGRAFVIRALLHGSPRGSTLAHEVSLYHEEVPYLPRGLSKLRLVRLRRRR